jgi:hypothetical protein
MYQWWAMWQVYTVCSHSLSSQTSRWIPTKLARQRLDADRDDPAFSTHPFAFAPLLLGRDSSITCRGIVGVVVPRFTGMITRSGPAFGHAPCSSDSPRSWCGHIDIECRQQKRALAADGVDRVISPRARTGSELDRDGLNRRRERWVIAEVA